MKHPPEQDASQVPLHESKQMLQTLMSNLPGMAYRCIIDDAWTMVFASEGTYELTGYVADEIYQNRVVSYEDLIVPQDRERVRSEIMRAVERDRQFQVSYRIQTKQGAKKWVWEKGCAVDRRGRRYLEGFITDISAIKHMEAVAQASAERANALLAAASRLNAQLDLHSVLDTVCEETVRANKAMASAIFLFEPRKQQFLPVAAHGFPTERVQQLRPIKKDIHDRYVGSSELPRYIPDLLDNRDIVNREVYHEMGIRGAAIAHVERNGALLGLLIAYFDDRQKSLSQERLGLLQGVSELAAQAISNARNYDQAQRLLQRTQLQANQIRQIVDSMPEGVVLLDGRRRILLANPTGADYLNTLGGVGVGASLTHLAGTPLDSLLERASAQTGWQELHAEQLQKIFEITLEPLRQGPTSGGWVMVLIDATEERERQKRQQMQERLATVGQLAAGIAHDFNNILGVITLYSEMLLATLELDETQHERLHVVNQQAQQASALIRQILDFSRQSVIERRPVELKSFVKEVVHLLDRTLPENIRVELTLEEHRSYIVSADLTRLQQVLMNLAVNARDAMPGGGVLRIAMRSARFEHDDVPLPEMSPGNWVVLSVADTGHGIREADMTRIFEPFFSTKPRGEGTGLGLAQVYGIIQQHEGFIDVASDVDEGAVFTLFLPTPITYTTTAEHITDDRLPRGNGEIILIVEDNPVIQQALHEILLLLNYHVLIAGNGEQALQLLEQQAGDVSLIISDLVMPRMGGAGLHEKLRHRFPDLTLVVMTGYPLEIQSRELLEYQDLFWVQKPFSVETIAETVFRALQLPSTPNAN